MRKSIFILFALLCSFCFAQKHMTFNGVEINGNVEDFIKKMEVQGFVLDTLDDGADRMMHGVFNGQTCELYLLYTPLTKTIAKAVVFVKCPEDWKTTKKLYNSFKKHITSGYGKPENDYKSFLNPYYEGDKREMDAIKKDKCYYRTFWKKDGSCVFMKFATSMQYVIHFEDAENFALFKSEKEEAKRLEEMKQEQEKRRQLAEKQRNDSLEKVRREEERERRIPSLKAKLIEEERRFFAQKTSMPPSKPKVGNGKINFQESEIPSTNSNPIIFQDIVTKPGKYDCLTNFCYENAAQHVGQTLCFTGSDYDREKGVVDHFYETLLSDGGYHKPYHSTSVNGKTGTPYKDVQGRYFYVNKVYKMPLGRYESKPCLYLQLIDKEANDTLYYEKSFSNHDRSLLTVGFFEKSKSLFTNDIITIENSGGYMLKNSDGQEIIVPDKTTFKCTEVFVIPHARYDDVGKVKLRLFNEKFGTFELDRSWIGDDIMSFVSRNYVNLFIKKYGTQFGKAMAMKRVKVGMSREMVEEILGEPNDYSSYRSNSVLYETYQYKSYKYINFRNGKVVSIQII